jgi:hypothetical protein
MDLDDVAITFVGQVIVISVLGVALSRFRRRKEEELWKLVESVFFDAVTQEVLGPDRLGAP